MGGCRREELAIEALIREYGVYIVALLIFVGELGIPTGIPVEIALLIAGSYSIRSLPELLVGLALVVTADVAGTTTLHIVARTGGVRLLNRLLAHFERHSEEAMGRWRRRLGGHDRSAVFVGRMLPIARMYVAVGSGLLRIPFLDFLTGAAPAALIWAGLPLMVGYFFRADVQSISTQYTRLTHIIIAVLPLIGVVAVIGWWIRRGGSLRGRIRRGRAALGGIAVVATLVYLVDMAVENFKAAERGIVVLSLPLLALWLALLGLLVLALLTVVVIDLRAAYRLWEQHLPFSHIVAAEVASTLVWLSLLATAGVVVLQLEYRYPFF